MVCGNDVGENIAHVIVSNRADRKTVSGMELRSDHKVVMPEITTLTIALNGNNKERPPRVSEEGRFW